ncbi:hypothetical protein J31TS4_14860 [Paenibacillus sp. J31TS4]|nr:hypothetical protein J31TS4_14860 [Paenibacillus sp. J31TS4]
MDHFPKQEEIYVECTSMIGEVWGILGMKRSMLVCSVKLNSIISK